MASGWWPATPGFQRRALLLTTGHSKVVVLSQIASKREERKSKTRSTGETAKRKHKTNQPSTSSPTPTAGGRTHCTYYSRQEAGGGSQCWILGHWHAWASQLFLSKDQHMDRWSLDHQGPPLWSSVPLLSSPGNSTRPENLPPHTLVLVEPGCDPRRSPGSSSCGWRGSLSHRGSLGTMCPVTTLCPAGDGVGGRGELPQ